MYIELEYDIELELEYDIELETLTLSCELNVH